MPLPNMGGLIELSSRMKVQFELNAENNVSMHQANSVIGSAMVGVKRKIGWPKQRFDVVRQDDGELTIQMRAARGLGGKLLTVVRKYNDKKAKDAGTYEGSDRALAKADKAQLARHVRRQILDWYGEELGDRILQQVTIQETKWVRPVKILECSRLAAEKIGAAMTDFLDRLGRTDYLHPDLMALEPRLAHIPGAHRTQVMERAHQRLVALPGFASGRITPRQGEQMLRDEFEAWAQENPELAEVAAARAVPGRRW